MSSKLPARGGRASLLPASICEHKETTSEVERVRPTPPPPPPRAAPAKVPGFAAENGKLAGENGSFRKLRDTQKIFMGVGGPYGSPDVWKLPDEISCASTVHDPSEHTHSLHGRLGIRV